MFELIITKDKQTKFILETNDNLYSTISKLTFKMYTINDHDIQIFPYHLFQNLNCFNIQMGNIYSLPEEFKLLQNLETLKLSNTDFQEFPHVVTELTNLKQLSFFQNSFESIPDSLVQLSNLHFLSLIHCRLTEFPKCILELTNLTELYLSGNERITIPNEISKLSKLERLGLHTNKIQDIPLSIFQLKYLEFLDLSSNDIRTIPTSIEKLKFLEELILSGNCNLHNCLFLNLPKLDRLVIDRHITDLILHENVENNISITNGFFEYKNTLRFINELERMDLLRQMKREHLDTLNIYVPNRIKCSICYSIFSYPRLNQQGNIYCKNCIEEHFKMYNTDPLTNVACTTKELFPVNVIETEVNEFIDNFQEVE